MQLVLTRTLPTWIIVVVYYVDYFHVNKKKANVRTGNSTRVSINGESEEQRGEKVSLL